MARQTDCYSFASYFSLSSQLHNLSGYEFQHKPKF